MLQNLLEKYTEKNDENVLEEAIEQFKQDTENRNQELLQFLEDFVTSEEYEQYLKHKKKIRKINVAVQYSLTDIKPEIKEIPNEEKYPLTTQSRKIIAFKRYLDKYIKNKNNKEIVKNQEEAIKIIREKIAEYRLLYETTKDRMYQTKEDKNNRVFEEFCESLDVDLSPLSLQAKNKIKDKVVCYQKIKHSRILKKKNNILNILYKLTEEYERKNLADKELNKNYLYKVKKRERIIKGMEIVGQKIILKPKIDTKEKEKVEEVVEALAEEEQPTTKKEKEKKQKDSKKDSKKGSKKGSKKSSDKKKDKDKKSKSKDTMKDKKSKKNKNRKMSKKESIEFTIPPIPKCTLRQKIGPENYEKLVDILENFENIEDIMEDQHILAQKYADEANFYDNTNFVCSPNALLFKNFYCGKIYKKKLKILNRSMQVQKIRILEVIFKDPYDALLFKIEPLFGVQKLPPGCLLNLTVKFSPEEECKLTEGRIIFVTYNRNSIRYQKIFVQIHCVPSHSDLKIYPTVIHFGKVPIWRAFDLNYKTIKVRNNEKKPCIVVINKVLDPLELQYNKNVKDVEGLSYILEECLENVFSNFQFEHRYLKLRGYEEKKLMVEFKNVEHVGNYFEKYCLDIYEACNDNTIGCQEVCISAETTDYFIEISSPVLDFGVCILNSIYQTSCDIYNNSKVTQSISLRFPSIMTEFIKTDISNLYIPAQTKRTAWLKLLPRRTILDISTYYDRKTNILEFPIQICVISKTYPDIPPIRATIFAVLTTQKCLCINPLQREFSNYSLDKVSLDLGECSIFETVVADIELINNTLAPQIYGFVNLPQCITILPNFGFGEITANERTHIYLYFNPALTDAIDYLNIEGSDSENVVHFRINLETVSHKGQTKQQGFNFKRFRKSVELMLNELKAVRNNDLIREMEIGLYFIKINLFTPDSDREDEEDSYNDKGSSQITFREKLSVLKEEIINTDCVTQLWLKAKITIPLVEFSHQYIHFPDTPCGSYSIMEIQLRALKVDYLVKNFNSTINYTASFKIKGENDEIRVEPTCGVLKKGEVKKLTLVVKPNIPEKIILETAKKLKYTELYESKRQEYELTKHKNLEAALKKGKKGKKNKGTEKKEKGKKQKEDKSSKENKSSKKDKSSEEDKKPKKGDKKSKKEGKKSKKEKKEPDKDSSGKEEKETEIVITEKDLQLDYLDFYPAEMFYWRNLEPYDIHTKFTCTLNYDSENMTRKSETLYLNADCRVIKPDFITNLKLQRINFDDVVIGSKKSKPVIIQNIHYDFIKPRFGLLSPVGPFALPHLKNVKIPPEHFLEIPVTFEPDKEGEVTYSDY